MLTASIQKTVVLALATAALPATAFAQARAEAQTPAMAQQAGIDAARRVVSTLTLANIEYALAFENGRLVLPAEWEEARLFVAEARRSSEALPVNLRGNLTTRIALLERRLAERFPAESLAVEVADIERTLTAAYGESLDERPGREPSIANGEILYRSTCTRCHGMEGRGDGPVALATRMDPPPGDLSDTALIRSTTPLDLYRKITLGIPATRMQPFGDALSREERWDLVAYILTLSNPEARRGQSGQMAVVFGSVYGPLAARLVLDAYMAFEAAEGSLAATEPKLVRRAEQQFTSLRYAIESGATKWDLNDRYAELRNTLRDCEAAFSRQHSSAGLFVNSLLLMLREGFEAILVIGAIMAVLIKAGARDKQRAVRWGIAAALAASLLTAAALEMMFRATAAQREALEGGVMLVAAALLFYVSYWLISKVEIAAWTRFVKGQVQKAVAAGSGVALAAVAFFAVYREGFETVLFYKALYVAGGSGGGASITAGLLVGLAVLVAVFIGIERFGLKIPMRPFFAVTGATLAFMAFMFAGNGIKALQEGGYVGSTLLPWAPRYDFFGIYPTAETLGVQALIVVALVFAMVWTFVIQPRRIAGTEAGAPLEPRMRGDRRTQSRKTTV